MKCPTFYNYRIYFFSLSKSQTLRAKSKLSIQSGQSSFYNSQYQSMYFRIVLFIPHSFNMYYCAYYVPGFMLGPGEMKKN